MLRFTRPARRLTNTVTLSLEQLGARVVPSTTATAPGSDVTTTTTCECADRSIDDIKADLKKALADYDSLKLQLATETGSLKTLTKQFEALDARIKELKKEFDAETDLDKKMVISGQIKEAVNQLKRVNDELGAQTKVVKDLTDKVEAAKKKIKDLLDELDKAKKDEELGCCCDDTTGVCVEPLPGDWSDIADDPDAQAAEADLADGDLIEADAQGAIDEAASLDMSVLDDLANYGVILDGTGIA
jgi:predicted RNase H-like nuclease (RuvC/YqgF family)